MGSSASKTPAVPEAEPVPDFFYKGKPYPDELPSWFTSVRLTPAELPHLKTRMNQKGKEDLRF